jgi:hypothetical protein
MTNKEFIKANEHHYTILTKAGYVQHLDSATRTRMLAIIKEEINPTYTSDLWCQTCVAEMVNYLYKNYKHEETTTSDPSADKLQKSSRRTKK